MRLKAKAACGDDDTSPSNTGLCSDFYVFKWVLTARQSQSPHELAESIEHDQPANESGKAVGQLHAELVLRCDYGLSLGTEQFVDE
jgi:hypothetical protein